ncbi:hypothetical protein [Bosea caraganae]|uniref:hypothetical protein n=1 Tax=Bosea caraganae TaxID=2763117 RepID=UPI0011C05842|nr:hypothetical protein [Bosea caraganae]
MDEEFDCKDCDRSTRLEGEILSSLCTWSAEYGLARLDLGWSVAKMLLKHVSRTMPLDIYIEFVERLAAVLGDEARAIRQVAEEDHRARLH